MDNTPYKLAILAAQRGLTIDELVNDALARTATKKQAADYLQVTRSTLWSYLAKRTRARAAAAGSAER